MKDLHKVQMLILKALIFHPNATFTDINIQGLTNDHFSYHVRTLLTEGLITKKDGKYTLTTKGKQFAGAIDTDTNYTEKQPKVSVLIVPTIIKDSKMLFAIQRRTKEPYFGYHGNMTGKMRYGEKVFDAAARELNEEMNLTAAKFTYRITLHEMVYDTSGEQLEDKIFNIVHAEIKNDTLASKTESGEHFWIDEAGFRKLLPVYHNELKILDWFLEGKTGFIEEQYVIENF
jgi:ADP-ribose pyrophosphatase YjhB (NUDIX family)